MIFTSMDFGGLETFVVAGAGELRKPGAGSRQGALPGGVGGAHPAPATKPAQKCYSGLFPSSRGMNKASRSNLQFFEKVDLTITGGREGNRADSREKRAIASRALPVAKTGGVRGIVG